MLELVQLGVDKTVVAKRYNAQLFKYFGSDKLLLYLCPKILAGQQVYANVSCTAAWKVPSRIH